MAYSLDDLEKGNIQSVKFWRIFDKFEDLKSCRLWSIGTMKIHVAMAVRLDCMKKHMQIE